MTDLNVPVDRGGYTLAASTRFEGHLGSWRSLFVIGPYFQVCPEKSFGKITLD